MQGGWEVKSDFFKPQRDILDKQIGKFLPSPQAELLSGILLGQNRQLPGQFKLALRDTSTLHIVVASGQNLSMVAGFFLLLSGLIKRKIALSLSFLAVIFYVFLTGVQVPVLRAAIMVLAGFLAQALGREKLSVWILILTAGLMLLINPKWISDLSFQLSFLATLGVIGVAPVIMNYLKKLPQFISQDLAVSLAAQIMVFPVIAGNFHQFSLVAIPANLLVLWTVPFIMILGAIFLIFSFIFPPLASFIALIANIFLTYFVYVVEFFGKLPNSWEYIGEV
ncbi:MAG: Uncharacterized protein G01um101493_268, partial [Microgenomates group bacterium Gr01-1014_93]